jgi:hypothetical protein
MTAYNVKYNHKPKKLNNMSYLLCSLADVTYSVGVAFYLWLSRVMSDITNQIE